MLAAAAAGITALGSGINVQAAQWTDIEGKTYYINDAGSLVPSRLIYYNGAMYQTDEYGAMVTGWRELGGANFLFDDNGRMVCNGATVDGYLVNEKGAQYGTIGVDPSTIIDVGYDGSNYTFTSDPTPEDPNDTQNNITITLPAAVEWVDPAGVPAEPKTDTRDSDSNSKDSEKETEQRKEVCSYAKTLLGVPYVWGGESSKGLDCSGLVRYVYMNTLGINLVHYADTQASAGKTVKISKLRPGDLCCYDWEEDGHVDHIGIYIGDGKVIEAGSESGKVVITGIKMNGKNPCICKDIIGF